MTIRELPIACSLQSEHRTSREDEWAELLSETLIERQAVPGGVALRMTGAPAVASRVRRLIQLEQQCCPWIHWTVSGGAVLSVEATSSHEDGARMLAQWFAVSTQQT